MMTSANGVRAGVLIVSLLLVLTTLAACGTREADLPAIPELQLKPSLAAVDEHIAQALSELLAAPLDAHSNGRLGMVLSAYGHTELAQPLFQRAHALAPGEFKWPYYIAATSHASGDATATVDYLQSAIKLNPQFGPARLRLAEIFIQNDRLNEATDSLATLPELMPDEPRLHLALGRLAHKRGDLEEARRHLERAVELAPAAGEPHHALAQVLRDQGQYDAAAQEVKEHDRLHANKLYAHDPALLEVTALNRSDLPHLTRAAYLTDTGNLAAAIKEYEAALAVNPVSTGAHAQLIRLHARRGEFDQAAARFADAKAREVVDAQVLMANAGAARAQDETSAALGLLEQALEMDPSQAGAWLAKAEMHDERGESDASIDSYFKYLAIQPAKVQPRWRLGLLLAAVGDLPAAQKQLREALAYARYLKPDVLRALANVALLSGEPDVAREHLQEARSIATERADLILLSAIDKDLARLAQ